MNKNQSTKNSVKKRLAAAGSLTSLALILTAAFNPPAAQASRKLGRGWVTLGYDQSSPKYTTRAGSAVDMKFSSTVANVGATYQPFEKVVLGGSVSGTLQGRTQDKTLSAGSTINGTGLSLFGTYIVRPFFMVFGALTASENRAKLERSSPVSGTSSSHGWAKGVSLGGAFFVPLPKKTLSTIKLTYSNNDSKNSAATLPAGSAGGINYTAEAFPAASAHLQTLMAAVRFQNRSFETFSPYVEWQGSWVISHGNSLKGIPFRMGNGLILGTDIPLTNPLSLNAQVGCRRLVTPGSGMGASVSLKYKF